MRAVPKSKVPVLPFEANAACLAWWADVWASPMAPEFVRSDIHGLFMLAYLVDEFWSEGAVDRKALLGEIRLQRQCFGLSPIDRRRLQWEIDMASGARAGSELAGQPPASPTTDERFLRAVS